MAESGDPPPVGGHGLGVLDGSADDFPPGPVVGDQLRDELEDLDGVVTVRKPIGRPLVGQDQSGELFGLPGAYTLSIHSLTFSKPSRLALLNKPETVKQDLKMGPK